MNIHRLSLPTLAFVLLATAASAATSDDTNVPAPASTVHQMAASSTRQADQATSSQAATVAASPAGNASSLPTPEIYWWKDR